MFTNKGKKVTHSLGRLIGNMAFLDFAFAAIVKMFGVGSNVRMIWGIIVTMY